MLNNLRNKLFLFVFCILFSSAAVAETSSETQRLSAERLVSQSADTLKDFESESRQWSTRIADKFKRAKAIIIIPQLRKAGFFIGGETGVGLLLVKRDGGWSQPIFYDISSLSLGIQFGYEQSQHLLFVMSDRALEKLQANKIEIGGEVSVSAGNAGGHGEVATTFTGIDIISYSLAAGLFAGFSFEGSFIDTNEKLNTAYYGANATAEEITGEQYSNSQADGLRQLLSDYVQ